MKLKYLTSYPKYLVSLILINLICQCLFWLLAYIDNINIINNGFITSNSISFSLKNTHSSFIVGKDKYILLQFNASTPNIKHVLISGDIQLPPIKNVTREKIFSQKGSIAIIGEQVRKENIPPTIKIVGYFDTANSYQLKSQVWVLSNDRKITMKNGNSFIFSTPKQNSKSVFNRNIKTDSIQFIDRQNSGTYSLKSNQTFNIVLYIALVFLIAFFVIISTNWMWQDKNIMSILYLSGTPISSLIYLILKWKVIPYVSCSFLFMMSGIFFQNFQSGLWSSKWLIDTAYVYILMFLYLCISCILTVTFLTVRKGGKRF